MSASFDVVVVGAGIAGLAAGAAAARGGASVVVLEAHQPGGRAQTTDRDGFTFNRGVHAFFTGGHGQAVLDGLGVRLVGGAPPLDQYRLVSGGEQHLLPLSPEGIAATTFLDAADKGQLGGVFERMPTLDPRKLQGLSVEDFLSGLELRPRVEKLLRTLFRLSTYADDLGEFGADAGIAQQQIAARSGVVYLDRGWTQLSAALGSIVEVRPHTAVRTVTADRYGAAVHTDDGLYTASAVVVAAGTPAATLAVLASEPHWGNLGAPVTAACLDVGTSRVPTPGYVVSLDDPLYGTVQSPPAQQAPQDGAVIGVIRYGTRNAKDDRASLESHLVQLGVHHDDIVTQRFLARMVVSSTMPRAATGGLAGRPSITESGLPRVFLAGDWIGPDGVLSDASLASGHAAGRAAIRAAATLPIAIG
jgi:glycine/D-amino acid oxidase-like deaminating enzyme